MFKKQKYFLKFFSCCCSTKTGDHQKFVTVSLVLGFHLYNLTLRKFVLYIARFFRLFSPHLSVFIFSFLLLLSGCASKAPDEFNQVEKLQPTPSVNISKIRQLALQDTASGLGAQAALAWRSKQFNAVFQRQSRLLDKVFNFRAMLLAHNVLPPVLVEGRNTLNLDDSETIRLSDHDYQIIFPAHFVTVAPIWRDYLWMDYKKPELPDLSLQPKNKAEVQLWNKYVRIGWNEGARQAQEIFTTNLNRLHRDYSGMILYHKLYAENMVSAPFVSQADLGVTGDSHSLRINDRVLRITATPELNLNTKNWRTVITQPKSVKVGSGDMIPKTERINISKAYRYQSEKRLPKQDSLKNLLEKLPQEQGK